MPDHLTTADCSCGEPIAIVTKHGDQHVVCPDCGAHFWATYDADGECEIGVGVRWRGGFSLTPLAPPTDMDLHA